MSRRTNLYLLPGGITVAGPNSREARLRLREARREIISRPQSLAEIISGLENQGFRRAKS